MNVLYASDDKFAGILGTSLVSLFENNQEEEQLQVYILDDAISEQSKKKLGAVFAAYKRKPVYVKIAAVPVPDAFVSDRWPRAAFVRLFISELFDESTERLLYLDCDTIIQAPLKALWETDLRGNILAGVNDCLSPRYLANLDIDKKSPYINSGVLLIDLKKYRQFHVREKVQRFMESHAGVIRYPDQDVINAVFKNHIYSLEPQYNTITLWYDFTYKNMCQYRKPAFYYTKQQIAQAVKTPVIIHFTTSFLSLRPWVKGSRHLYKDRFLYYRALSPWKNEPLWEDNRSKLKKAYVKLYHCMPLSVSVAFSGFLHATAVPALKKTKKGLCNDGEKTV